MLAPRTRRPPTSTVISGADSDSRFARSRSRCSGGSLSPASRWFRNPSLFGSSTSKDSTSVCSCVASVRPGRNGTVTSCPASLAAFSTAAQPPRTIRSASDTFLPKLLWMPLELRQHRADPARLVDRPVLLGGQADPSPVGAAALVGVAVAGRRRPRREDEVGDRQAGVEDRLLERRDVRRRRSARPRPPAPGPATAAARAPTGRGSGTPDPCRGAAACTRRVRRRRRTRRGCRGTAPRSSGTPGPVSRARSVVAIIGACRTFGSWASGTVSAPAPSFGCHCWAPAGLWPSSHS